MASRAQQDPYPVQFDDEMAAFVTGGISITLASRNAALVPSISRAKGCRVLRGAAIRLRIFVSRSQAGDLLNDIRSIGAISATFTRPETHRTLQFKGTDARVDAMNDEDRAALAAARESFAVTIRPLGFSGDFARAFLGSDGDEVAIEFTLSDAFRQTPGPGAGERL